MDINSAFSSGVSGFNKASQQISDSSQSIANQSVSSAYSPSAQNNHVVQPITAEVINMKLAEIQAQASAKVIATADEMVGSLIDVSV